VVGEAYEPKGREPRRVCVTTVWTAGETGSSGSVAQARTVRSPGARVLSDRAGWSRQRGPGAEPASPWVASVTTSAGSLTCEVERAAVRCLLSVHPPSRFVGWVRGPPRWASPFLCYQLFGFGSGVPGIESGNWAAPSAVAETRRVKLGLQRISAWLGCRCGLTRPTVYPRS